MAKLLFHRNGKPCLLVEQECDASPFASRQRRGLHEAVYAVFPFASIFPHVSRSETIRLNTRLSAVLS